MKIKILAAIFTMGVVASTYAKNIDYCKTIEFDTGGFNYSAILQASSDSECRDKPVPIQHKGIKDTFILTSEANPTGGASYLTWDESTKTYGYDKDELKSTIHGIVKQSGDNKYIEALNPIVKIKFTPKDNGGWLFLTLSSRMKITSQSASSETYIFTRKIIMLQCIAPLQ